MLETFTLKNPTTNELADQLREWFENPAFVQILDNEELSEHQIIALGGHAEHSDSSVRMVLIRGKIILLTDIKDDEDYFFGYEGSFTIEKATFTKCLFERKKDEKVEKGINKNVLFEGKQQSARVSVTFWGREE